MYKMKAIGMLILMCCLTVGAHAAKADAFDDLGLTAGQWYQVPNSKLENHFPTPTPEGRTGPSSVMAAWSGGAYDSTRDRLIVWGGGHADYSGNELYAFDITTLQWTRLTEPSPTIAERVTHYADGRPTSRHTYGSLQYLPDSDVLLSMGMSAGYGDPPIDSNSVDVFDFDDGLWENKNNKVSNGYNVGAFTAYDSSTGYAWHHGTLNGALARYNPATDSWTKYASTDLELYMTMDIDTGRDLLVGVGNNQGVRTWDLNNPNNASIRRTTSGDKTLESRSAPGFAYDPVVDQFVGWSGGNSLYLLDPADWSWSKVVGSGATPTSAEGNGTYGRFRYIPSKNAYIVVNRTNENVYLFKLSSGAGTTFPQINLSASPSSVPLGESSTVSWSVSNADSCTASGGGLSGSVGMSGSQVVGPLSSNVTVTLQCNKTGGATLSRSVTVCIVGSCSSGGSSGGGSSGGSSGGGSSSGGSSGGNIGNAENGEGEESVLSNSGGGTFGPWLITLLLGLGLARRSRRSREI